MVDCGGGNIVVVGSGWWWLCMFDGNENEVLVWTDGDNWIFDRGGIVVA